MRNYIYLCLSLFFIINIPISAQKGNFFAESLIIGSSITYIRNSYEPEVYFHEWTWNSNIGIRLSKRLFSGIQILNIYTRETAESMNYNYIYGVFSQYNFYKDFKHRFFIEASINRGNYCVCENVTEEDKLLYFLGLGMGYDLPLKWIPNLYLDLSFMNYFVIDDFHINYTQYIIGLNYKLRSK